MQKNNCCNQLPDGYNEIYKIDLRKDKKAALIVNLLSLIICIILFILGHFIVPVTTIFNAYIAFLYAVFDGFGNTNTLFLVKILTVIVCLVVYMVLHELVHGICMKHFGAKKVKYGFTGLYAYAGCDCYFSKTPYIITALAPIVVWGIVLLMINLLVDSSWFWVIYIIQVGNISGAAGDLYVTYKFSKMPKDILVHDSGIAMEVYSKTNI